MTRLWRWVVWALDLEDGGAAGDPSLTKLLALLAGLLVVYSVVTARPITATHVTLTALAVSAAFGRSMWRAWLNKTTFAVSSREERSVRDTTVHQILERRDPESGVDPAP